MIPCENMFWIVFSFGKADFSNKICYTRIMNSATKKNQTVTDILSEIKSLRRELSLFLPTESINDYENEKEIVDALKKARKEHSS